jgi:hypothetical protein
MMFSPSRRQRHSFVLQPVQIFLNSFCLCSFYSRIYDTVSYQLESNQVNQIESEDRIKNILHAVNNKSDFDMVSLIQSVDNFLENALYHSSRYVIPFRLP